MIASNFSHNFSDQNAFKFSEEKKKNNFCYLIMQQKDRTGLSAMELSRKISNTDALGQ